MRARRDGAAKAGVGEGPHARLMVDRGSRTARAPGNARPVNRRPLRILPSRP